MALLIVEHAFRYNGAPYGFNRRASHGAPKRWPKYRTSARISNGVLAENICEASKFLQSVLEASKLSSTKLASPNRSDHGGCKRLQKSQGLRFAGRNKSQPLAIFGVTLKIAGSSQ